MYSTNPDRNDSSLVSVVIPAWNRADVLEYTLQSLRAQTYNAWEGLVVDDHSTDKTEDLVKKMAGADDRIAYQRRTQSAKGAPACRYQGLKKAKGKYVIFLDSDDRLHPRCLEGRVAVMETRPDLAYVVYPAELFSQNLGDTRLLWNTFSSTGDLDRFLKHDAPWQTTGPIWRTAYRRTFGHYWHETALSWQDWEFHTLALLDPVRYG
jgi:glycosyltransferase involved in cell wall biosynthesis